MKLFITLITWCSWVRGFRIEWHYIYRWGLHNVPSISVDAIWKYFFPVQIEGVLNLSCLGWLHQVYWDHGNIGRKTDKLTQTTNACFWLMESRDSRRTGARILHAQNLVHENIRKTFLNITSGSNAERPHHFKTNMVYIVNEPIVTSWSSKTLRHIHEKSHFLYTLQIVVIARKQLLALIIVILWVWIKWDSGNTN